ncbi:MAG: tungsten-containing formylmethanofuran dehydrogenase 2 subunit B [Burkholderiales bacterium]|nr:MAG: tungsten-containing formylmethanofuran dehydrogenase 2 subunit B [Burkholderiales bacterium]
MSSTGVLDPVACPFCGLLCDDLRIAVDEDRLTVAAHGCPISVGAFAGLPPQEAAPRIAGRAASLEEAAVAAAHLLKGARQPLFAGLGTDVAGMRRVLELADRCGAVLDHMNAESLLRNVRTLQEAGLMSTSLSEVKNRADLVLIVGGDVASRYPRFFERVVWNEDALFRPEGAWPEVVYLGEAADPSPGTSPDGRPPWVVPCPRGKLIEVIGALRCLVAGRPLDAREAGGVPMEKLEALADRLRRARYGVAVWSATDLDFPHAELTVQSLCDLVKELNRETRFCGLPLAGSDADFTANEVHVWQTGVALRSSLAAGYPEYDPYHYAAARLLARGEADALVWISSLSDRPPPETDVPTVVLGGAGLLPPREPEVFIPVGRPGVDHAAHLFRADKAVVMRLGPLRASVLPSVAQALSAILDAYCA